MSELSEQIQAAVERLAQASGSAIEAMRAIGIGLSHPAVQRAIAERCAQHEEAAMRLAILTPLTPEQARSLIQEHGLGFAERVGDLVARGWWWERAVDALTGRDPIGALAARNVELTSSARFDTGALQATPINLPRCRCIPFNPIIARRDRSPRCPYPPRHGTPSSFVEVCGDAAIALHQPVLTPCATCRNHNDNPYLSCAVHPLRRPGHECGDWEDGSTEAAEKARFDAQQRSRNAEVEAESGRFRVSVGESFVDCGPDHWESERVEWRSEFDHQGREHRWMISRTRYRHYADGRREIIAEPPSPI